MVKKVLIIGGSRGIGKKILEDFASLNYDVSYTYNKSKVSNIKNIKSYRLDLNNKKSIDSFLKSLTSHNFDILINNAAISQKKDFLKLSLYDWQKMFMVNLFSYTLVIKQLLPYMIKKKWGRIINVASIGGQWGGYDQFHYAASKSALINLTQSIAKKYSKYNITSNAVSPGLIITDMSNKEIYSQKGKNKILNSPIGRFGKTEEVSKVVTFLASELSSYITGQTINVNGGMLFN